MGHENKGVLSKDWFNFFIGTLFQLCALNAKLVINIIIIIIIVICDIYIAPYSAM